jgi:cysteine desulfurase
MIYLDYNATSPMKPAVRAAVLEAMERCGNPSSVHRYGRIARRYVEEARAAVAALAGVKPAQVIFTSGGTEANNMVFNGAAPDYIMTSSIEHDSVLACTKNAARLPVTSDGVIDLSLAEQMMATAPHSSIISVMLVNNETGVVQPVEEIAQIAKKYSHKMHTDAVQAFGRLPIDFKDLGVDCLTISAHKIAGPQGVGALIVSEKIVTQSLLTGGGQEMNRRAGTENVAGIIGFGVAAQLAVDDLRNVPQQMIMRDELQARLLAAAGNDVEVIGHKALRVANTLCIAMGNISSETQVMAMDLGGVAVSAGSACSSGKVKASHVLRAMGYADDVAGSAMRISIGWDTKPADLEKCHDVWASLYQRTRKNAQSKAA